MDERRIPRLSVIVPVYNVEPYIGRCARSLFAQSMDDIEFIFIDDCSQDASMSVLQAVMDGYPARKPWVKCVRMPVNSGQAAVRMKGLELAAGEYIGWCDSDDEVLPQAFSGMYAKAVETGADIVTCDFSHERDGKLHRVCGAAPSGSEIQSMLYAKTPWNLVNRIARRSLFDGLLPPAGNMGEDMVITLQLTLRARSFAHVDESLYLYHHRPGSFSEAPGKEVTFARWQSLHANVDLIVGLLTSSCGYSGSEPELIAFKYYGRHCLEPLVHIPEYYRIWKNTYPEVDGRLLSVPGVPAETKFWYVLTRLGLYHFVKQITGFLKGRK